MLGTPGAKPVHEVAGLEDVGEVKFLACELKEPGKNALVAKVTGAALQTEGSRQIQMAWSQRQRLTTWNLRSSSRRIFRSKMPR